MLTNDSNSEHGCRIIRVRKGVPLLAYIVTRKEFNGLFIPIATFFSSEEAQSYIGARERPENYSVDALPLPISPKGTDETDGDYVRLEIDERALNEIWRDIVG